MKNFMFCIFLLCILFIPTAAFASTGDTSSNLLTNIVSLFFGTQTPTNYLSSNFNNNNLGSSTSYGNTENCDTSNSYTSSEDCGTTKDTYYSKDDCNNQPPADSYDLWQRYYCGGGEWGSF